MSFFKKLFSPKKATRLFVPPASFANDVEKAIRLIGQHDGALENAELVNLLESHNIEKLSAIEIVIFLPEAFTRLWLHPVKWQDSYIELFDDNKQVEIKYEDTPAYTVIWQIASQYFSSHPDAGVIIKIGGRSSGFNAINSALMHDSGTKLEDLLVSQTVIMR